jgi:hypothetical protein
MLKINLQMQALVLQLNTGVNQVQGQVAAANQIAWQSQAAAQGAANVDRFRPAAPPKYGDKKKGEHVGHWIPVIENYLQTAPDADYIRLASSYLEGGPHALWTNVYEAYKRANGGNEPPNPRRDLKTYLQALHERRQSYFGGVGIRLAKSWQKFRGVGLAASAVKLAVLRYSIPGSGVLRLDFVPGFFLRGGKSSRL